MNKKMLLSLGVIALLGAMQVCAYTHKIINTTEYPARVLFGYVGCKDDYREVAPGETVANDGKLCIIGKISAVVKYSGLPQSAIDLFGTVTTKEVDMTKMLQLAQPKDIETKFNYKGPYTGSSTWLIYGSPLYGFGITRKVE
jgi:hypothetical protein